MKVVKAPGEVRRARHRKEAWLLHLARQGKSLPPIMEDFQVPEDFQE